MRVRSSSRSIIIIIGIRRRHENKKKELSQDFEGVYADVDGKRILDSWWFFTSDWPPGNFDYGPALKKLKLRRVGLKDFSNEPEFNNKSEFL